MVREMGCGSGYELAALEDAALNEADHFLAGPLRGAKQARDLLAIGADEDGCRQTGHLQFNRSFGGVVVIELKGGKTLFFQERLRRFRASAIDAQREHRKAVAAEPRLELRKFRHFD